MKNNPLYSKYAQVKDRESAYEELQEQAQEEAEQEEKERRQAEKEAQKKKKAAAKKSTSSRKKKSVLDKAVTSAANTIGRELGKSLIRGLLGSLKK